jgi:transcriptional regulator with XRE-family HTH domain
MAKRKSVPITHPEIVRRFAARLREVRRQRGLTQRELAERAEITETYLSRLESVGAAPGIDLVDRLATALGTTVHDLLPLADQPDTRAALRREAERLVGTVAAAADQDALALLNQLLAMMTEAVAKRRADTSADGE